MRIVHVAVDAAFQRLLGGEERVVRLVRARAGHAFDPELAACLIDDAERILALEGHASVWEETLACEPPPQLLLEGNALDRGLAAMGNFADLISPYLAGHSAGAAELAAAAARSCRIDEAGVVALRHAALVHDLGRVAVHPRIWQKPGPLTADEWEQVRLHPYHTERVLSRSRFLSALAPIAGAHHERPDGSGYHRAAAGPELGFPARLLAAADAYHAMTEPRSHREPVAPERAAEILGEEASAGRLDATAVTAVVESAGEQAPRIERPAGLTEREAEVVGLVARGLQTKQVARVLGISVKTADRHIQNAYRKIGVSTRAAATLFAMEHGLMAWGELPISRPAAAGRSQPRGRGRADRSARPRGRRAAVRRGGRLRSWRVGERATARGESDPRAQRSHRPERARRPEPARCREEAHSRLKMPVRLANGSKSPPIFPRVIDRLVELIPRVTRETIEGTAHVPHLTTPERYVEVTTRGVQQHAALRRRGAKAR